MTKYIKQSVEGYYFELATPLSSRLYNIGESFQDFENGAYIRMTSEMEAFKKANPTATVKEVINCQLDIIEITIEEAKAKKIAEIDAYDSSSEVNGFYFQAELYWLDKATRVGLMNSTNILKDAGEENTTLWLGNINVTLPCDQVIQMLSALEIYALKCYNVTAEHKNYISKSIDKIEIESFDITRGYPEKLKF